MSHPYPVPVSSSSRGPDAAPWRACHGHDCHLMEPRNCSLSFPLMSWTPGAAQVLLPPLSTLLSHRSPFSLAATETPNGRDSALHCVRSTLQGRLRRFPLP